MPKKQSDVVILDRKYTALPEGVPLNPMQEMLVPLIGTKDNVLVTAPTASGKSTAMYMLGNDDLEDGKTVMYIGIMRALAQEKADDLEDVDHPWHNYAKTVISGDYKMDASKNEEIDTARVICITPESLAVRLRHADSDKNKFLKRVGRLVVDEVHLLAAVGRGANLEAALLEFAASFPHVPLVGLSATVPNAEDLVKWFTVLNGKPTHHVNSTYRPVPLRYHFISYTPGTTRDSSEMARIEALEEITDDREDQQFLVGVWNKAFGNRLKEYYQETKRERVAFHNANHDRETRRSIEASFKSGTTRVLISTSTLFTGVNLPARNVVITAVEAARQPIPVYELMQIAGRAGRPRYDTEGDAFFLLPEATYDMHRARIERGEDILSQMHAVESLATHFLGAVYLGRVYSRRTFADWFDRTLAHLQLNYTKDEQAKLLDAILADMQVRRMVKMQDKERSFCLTHRGTIAAQMYLDPYHFADILRNMNGYTSLTRATDLDLARALGECNAYATQTISASERAAVPEEVEFGGVSKRYWKSVAVVWYRLQGDRVPAALSSMNYTIFDDMPRLHAAVARAHEECEDWDIGADTLDMLFMRAIKSYDAETATLAVKKFTRSERRKLNALGLYTFRDVQSSLFQAREVLAKSRMLELGLMQPDGSLRHRKEPFGGVGTRSTR